jgi:hypothetical protein
VTVNSISVKLVSLPLGLAALTVISSTMSARAETPSTDLSFGRSQPTAESIQAVEPTVTPVASVDPLANTSAASIERSQLTAESIQAVEPAVTPATTVDSLATNPSVKQIPENTAGQPHVQPDNLGDINQHQANTQTLQWEAIGNDQQTSSKAAAGVTASTPTPGTLKTSATYLTGQPQTSALPEVSSDKADPTVAQVDIDPTRVTPGQATRGGSSYIGIGGNIGFSGATATGGGAFVVNSKIGLTRTVSVRPSVVISNDVDFLIPVTYDFVIQSDDPFAPVPFAPFAGGGLAISTSSNSNIGFLLTGGVDVPLSREFVANAAINAAFMENTTDVGIVIGVGYTFPNFRR